MPTGIQALDYATPLKPPRKLTLEQAHDFVKLTFPLPPRWVYMCWILGMAAAGTFFIAIGISIWFMERKLLHRSGLPPGPDSDIRHYAIMGIIFYGGAGLFLWLTTIHELRKYLRLGRVPRTLAATSESFTYSRPGWIWMKNRHWQRSQIASIDLKPVRGNLTWWRTVAVLTVRFHNGRSRHFHLNSSDPNLPTQIAGALRTILNIGPPKPEASVNT